MRWMTTAIIAGLLSFGVWSTMWPRTVTTYTVILTPSDAPQPIPRKSATRCGPAIVDAWRKPDDPWFGYAPNTSATFHPGSPCATEARIEVLIGLVFLALGIVGAWHLLRPIGPFVELA